MTRDEYYAALGDSKEALKHHGTTGMEWGKRNGPPYPLNAEGKAALKEQKKKARDERNHEIGKERLENRIKKANEDSDVDKLSSKVGWDNTMKAAERHREIKNIKQLSNEILDDEKRTTELGRVTRNTRIATIVGTSIGSATVATVLGYIGVCTVESLAGGIPGLFLGAATIAAGKEYYDKTKY